MQWMIVSKTQTSAALLCRLNCQRWRRRRDADKLAGSVVHLPSQQSFDSTSARTLARPHSDTCQVQGPSDVEDQAAALLHAVDSLTAAVASRQGLLEESAAAQQGSANVPGFSAGRGAWAAAADAVSSVAGRIAGRNRA